MNIATQNMRRRFEKLFACCCCLATSLIAGCGDAPKPWEVVVPALGEVTYEGEPIVGAQITLVPVSTEFPDTVRPSAISALGGNFALGTYGNSDGAPAGEYKASVVWFKLDESGDSPVRGDNVLPPKYANPDSSGITVVVNDKEPSVISIALTEN